jgi:hypothetical protein
MQKVQKKRETFVVSSLVLFTQQKDLFLFHAFEVCSTKMVIKASTGQGLSNEPKFVKIVCLEPDFMGGRKTANNIDDSIGFRSNTKKGF